MSRMNGINVAKRSRSTWWCLPCLFGGLALGGPALAAPAGTAVPIDDARQASPAQTTYRVINLGTADLSALPAINAGGQVAFSLNTPAGSRAWFYDGATIRDIGTLGGPASFAPALNDAGQVAGYSSTASGFEHAFVWTLGRGMTDLGTLPDAANSQAAAINNRGVIVGTSEGVPATSPRAFRWSAAQGMADLGAFTTGLGSFSSAVAINDAGLAAGFSTRKSGDRHAFVWARDAGLTDIDTLGSIDSIPVGIGAGGQVAGNVFVSPIGDYRAFVWTRAGGMRDLGAAGGMSSAVTAMSASGQVAGVINLASGFQRAMFWTQTGGMLKLGTLGGPGSNAIAVNNKGQVVGFADRRDGQARAYVWTRTQGMVDLNQRLRRAPAGLLLDAAVAISDNGSIVATSNAGLVLLTPGTGPRRTHALGPIAAADLVDAGAAVDAAVSFAAEDTAAQHHVTWAWGDGSGERAGNTRASNGAGSGFASHTYSAPGIYTVTATVVDLAGNRAAVSRKVVVVDRSGGFVGGSGAFMSPQGANRKARIQAGKAYFSFVAPAATKPKAAGAAAALHFSVAGLSFRSTRLQAVALQGAGGQFEGSGSINGKGDYRFALDTTAGAAGETGRFGLKIWHLDPATGAQVVDYDNRSGASIAEGRIAIQR